MKRLRFSLGDLLAAALGAKNTPSLSLRIPVKDDPDVGTASDDPALIQEQLADARAERRRQRTGRVASLSDAVLRTSVGRGNREGSMLGSKDSKAQDRECGMMSR